MKNLLKRSLLLALMGLIGQINAADVRKVPEGMVALIVGEGIVGEGAKVVLPREAAELSEVIKGFLPLLEEDQEPIFSVDVSPQELKFIADSMGVLAQVEKLKKQKGLKLYEFRKQLKESLQSKTKNMSFETLLNMLRGVGFLIIPELERAYAAMIADRLVNDKTGKLLNNMVTQVKDEKGEWVTQAKFPPQYIELIDNQAYLSGGKTFEPLKDYLRISISDLLEYDLAPSIEENMLGEKTLYLKNKYISSLKGLQDIPDIKTVQLLNLHNNKITSIAAGSFKGLENLKELNLNNNQITSIAAGSFKDLGNLQRLYLGDNQITSIAADSFKDLGNLQRLYLENNQITNIPADSFKDLENLQLLDLSNNQITNIPAGSFNDLGNLRELRLSNNKITSIPAGSFKDLGNLQRLYLENNQITSIAADSFKDLGNLEGLYLENNQLNDATKQRIKDEVGVNAHIYY